MVRQAHESLWHLKHFCSREPWKGPLSLRQATRTIVEEWEPLRQEAIGEKPESECGLGILSFEPLAASHPGRALISLSALVLPGCCQVWCVVLVSSLSPLPCCLFKNIRFLGVNPCCDSTLWLMLLLKKARPFWKYGDCGTDRIT